MPKTAIITPFSLYEFVHITFGHRNAAQSFYKLMDQVLRGLNFCFDYVDDLLVASSSPKEHTQHLRLVLERLASYGLTINPNKCVWGAAPSNFLAISSAARLLSP